MLQSKKKTSNWRKYTYLLIDNTILLLMIAVFCMANYFYIKSDIYLYKIIASIITFYSIKNIHQHFINNNLHPLNNYIRVQGIFVLIYFATMILSAYLLSQYEIVYNLSLIKNDWHLKSLYIVTLYYWFKEFRKTFKNYKLSKTPNLYYKEETREIVNFYRKKRLKEIINKRNELFGTNIPTHGVDDFIEENDIFSDDYDKKTNNVNTKSQVENTNKKQYDYTKEQYFNKLTHENRQKDQEIKEDIYREKAYFEAIEELSSLVGLEELKKEVEIFLANIEIMKKKEEAGYKQNKGSMHMIFNGPAGTGKTTVARIMAKLLYGLGYLSQGHLIEADRENLIAGYVGQTAIKTKDLVNEAMGGVLFIDEAYSLTPRDNGFEQEAIDSLVKLMEDNREDLIIIFAGYEKEMKKFIKSNSGLASRIPYIFHFEAYNKEELLEIAHIIFKNKEYNLTNKGNIALINTIEEMIKYSQNQNGRLIRTFIERVEKEQNNRLYITNDENLFTITDQDIILAKQFISKQNKDYQDKPTLLQ